jgi:hypothetical protein
MSSYAELYIDQGATFSTILDLTDETTNDSMNLVGYSVRSALRRSYYSANSSANLVCTLSDAANGQITLGLASANTANLRAGRYLFDVELVGSTGIVTRVLEGTITITPEITK